MSKRCEVLNVTFVLQVEFAFFFFRVLGDCPSD